MTFEEKVRLIRHLDMLIRMRFKGNAYEYAKRMNISRAAFFRLLAYMKLELDAPISHNRINGCYEYSKDGIISFGFFESLEKKTQGERLT